MSSTSSSPSRSAREVIDKAIQENRDWEWLCFVLSIAFAVVGLAVLVIGAMQSEGLVALSGSVASVLFWPSMRYAIKIREANIRIRMFELALGYAKTGREAAELIRQAMTQEAPRSGR